MSELTKLKISQSKKGVSTWNKGLEGTQPANAGSFKKGQKPHNYKGRYKTTEGYIDVHVPEHPFARSRGYVMEHRLVMEQRLGRYLTPKEHVHHINEIRDDNRIENLVFCASNSEHRKLHATKPITEKTCTVCKETKPVAEFPHRMNSPKAKLRYRYYSSWCKKCSHLKRHPPADKN